MTRKLNLLHAVPWIIGLLAAALIAAVWSGVAGYIFYDPAEPDFGRLFTDVTRSSSPVQPLDGEITDARFHEIEPGFSVYRVRQRDGSVIEVVLNSSTRVVWPGTKEETAAAGMYGEINPPPLGVDDLVGLRIVGSYRDITIGPLLQRERQAFVVRAAFK